MAEYEADVGMVAASPEIPAAFEGVRLFGSDLLTDEDRRALADIAGAPRPLKAGVQFVAEGARVDSVHLMIQGWAYRYKTTRDGARQITGLAVPGDMCNLDSYMLPRVTYGVRTLTEAVAVSLPRDRAQALAAERPGIARAFTWFAIVENAALTEWTLALGRQTARQRLAHLLCEVHARLGGAHGKGDSYELPLTQEQMADVLGLTGVHVNRTLGQLRAEGLIVVRGRQVTVLKVAELCQVGEFDDAYLHASPSVEGAGRDATAP